jgi:hypothetical protein
VTATIEPEVGVRYTARRNTDGTWNVYDVPIMGPVPKGVRKAPEDIGAEWLREAVKTAKMRELEGYYAPLYLGHTEDDSTPQRCGFVRLQRVAEIVYSGERVPCVFADYVCVPDRFFQRFAAGELPYRSVEVWDWRKPEINALAALDSDVPYFRLAAMTGVRVEGEAPATLAERTSLDSYAPSPMAAFRASERGAAILFAFDPKPKGKDEQEDKGGAEPNTGAPFGGGEDGDKGEGEGAGGEPGPAAEDANDGDDPTDEAPDDDPKVKAADEMVAGVMGKLDGIASALARLCAVLCPAEEAAPPSKPKPGLEPEDLNSSGDVSHMGADPKEIHKMSDKKPDAAPPAPVDPAQFAELRGEIAALREKDKARETRDTIATLSAAARKELEGHNVGPETEADIAAFAALGKEHLDRFVAAFKRTSPKDPAKSLDEIEKKSKSVEVDPEVAKFAEKLPEETRGAYFSAVNSAGAEFDAIAKTPNGKRALRNFTRASYIKNHPTVAEFAA